MDTYDEQYHDRFSKVTNKFFDPDPRVVVGDGINVQYELGPADSVRMQRDPLGEIASPARFDPGEMKIRWNANDTSAHDFTQVSARVQFDIYTIENMSKGTIVDAADRVYNSVQKDYEGKMAVLRHADRTGQIALVNGTPVEADRESFALGTATADNTDGMRFQLDNGSISAFIPNTRLDFYDSTGVTKHAGNVRITDIPNFADRSVPVEFVTSGLPSEISTGDLSTVADNDIIVYSGMYNASFYSFGAYFSPPANANDSFIGGKNRTSKGYRWMLPQFLRRADSAAPIRKSFFNDAAVAQGFTSEDPINGVAWLMDPLQHQALRDELGEPSFIQIPTGSDSKRFMNFGSMGLNYQHPTYGLVKILADGLARTDRILILVNGTWKTLFYGHKGLKPIPRAGGHWYWMNQGTPNTGQGLIKCADWYGNHCDWCTAPWRNAAILNLSTPT